MPVEFRPRNRSDIRFDGLIDIDDDAFGAIRDGLLHKLERVHEAILGGRPEDEVYALWRELNAADVDAARERLARPLSLPPADPARRVAKAVARTKGSRRRPAPSTSRCRSRRAAATRSREQVAALALVAPAARLGARPPRRRRRRAAAGGRDARAACRCAGSARVARLLLADLLPGVDRAVVLRARRGRSTPTSPSSPRSTSAATRSPRRSTPGASGFGVIHRAAARLGDDTAAASELRRTAHARHAFDFDAFTADALVLDLERMRAERFGAAARWRSSQAFGLRELEVLHYLAGPDRATIPERLSPRPPRPRRLLLLDRPAELAALEHDEVGPARTS